METKIRCGWADTSGEFMRQFHDIEWGVPRHDDAILHEWLVLNVFQAGLGWKMLLGKRSDLKAALDGFKVAKIASYDEMDVERLMGDTRMIRNFVKINGIINNAQKFLEVQREFGSFDQYIWSFVRGEHLNCQCEPWSGIECNIGKPEAEIISTDLKKRGFKFFGPKTAFGYMEDVGLMNDHSKNAIVMTKFWRCVNLPAA